MQQGGFFDQFVHAPVDPSQVSPSGIGKVAPSADPTAKRCSEAGARKISSSIDALHQRMLGHYRLYRELTDAEMADLLGVERTTVIPRRSELMTAKQVRAVGIRMNEKTGVPNRTYGLSR